MPMNWDGEADRKLFLSILRDQNVKVDSKAVATALSTGTTHCTPRAVEERLKKLKKMALEATSCSSGDRQSPPRSKKKATTCRKRYFDSDTQDDDEPTPTKRARKAEAFPTKSSSDGATKDDGQNESVKEEIVDDVF